MTWLFVYVRGCNDEWTQRELSPDSAVPCLITLFSSLCGLYTVFREKAPLPFGARDKLHEPSGTFCTFTTCHTVERNGKKEKQSIYLEHIPWRGRGQPNATCLNNCSSLVLTHSCVRSVVGEYCAQTTVFKPGILSVFVFFFCLSVCPFS